MSTTTESLTVTIKDIANAPSASLLRELIQQAFEETRMPMEVSFDYYHYGAWADRAQEAGIPALSALCSAAWSREAAFMDGREEILEANTAELTLKYGTEFTFRTFEGTGIGNKDRVFESLEKAMRAFIDADPSAIPRLLIDGKTVIELDPESGFEPMFWHDDGGYLRSVYDQLVTEKHVKLNAPLSSSEHYRFWQHIQKGGMVWREDPLNQVREWIDLNSLGGDANRIQIYGYRDLSLPEELGFELRINSETWIESGHLLVGIVFNNLTGTNYGGNEQEHQAYLEQMSTNFPVGKLTKGDLVEVVLKDRLIASAEIGSKVRIVMENYVKPIFMATGPCSPRPLLTLSSSSAAHPSPSI